MVIKIPQRHSFPETFSKKILDKTNCSFPEWEISVPRKDDIAWSVVLSYLISTNYKDSEDFQRRLNLLTGNDGNIKSVKKSIKYFNPFRNRCACFYNEALKTVINDFKIHMNWNNLVSVNDKLSAVSKALRCPIILIPEHKETQNIRIFSRNCKKSDDLITLLTSTFVDSENENRNITVFNFLIGGQIGMKMRKAALVYYLKEAKLSKKEIKILTTIDDSNNSFLIALLKSSHRRIIMKLYQNSYVISKLSDATYKMDPRKKDSKGLSALYYALVFNQSDTNVLYKLYDFAANNCCENEGSYRNPDFNIVSNLCCMEKLLSSDMSNLQSIEYDPSMNETSFHDLKAKFTQLIKFNKFLIEVSSNILNVKHRLNYYDKTDDDIFETNKRRDVIVVLLETYDKFFHCIDHDISLQISLDAYISFWNYYNLIDRATAILFFDNIVYLKEKLTLETETEKTNKNEDESGRIKNEDENKNKNEGQNKNENDNKNENENKNKNEDDNNNENEDDNKNENEFSKIESSFLIFIFYHFVFKRKDVFGIIKTSILEINFDLKSLYIFPLIKRFGMLDKLNEFSKILNGTNITKHNVVQHIPENAIYSTLYTHLDLKYYIEFLRLKQFMDIGTNVYVTNEKSVLVIQRVLQVIGENFVITCPSKSQRKTASNSATLQAKSAVAPEKNDNFFFKRLISLCIPKEISQILLRLRNRLSHLKGYEFPCKFECESNFSLFRSIQKEICQLERRFKLVYTIITLNVIMYAFKHLKVELQSIKKSIQSYICTNMLPDVNLYERMISFITNNLPVLILQRYRPDFQNFLRIALQNLEIEINSEYLSSGTEGHKVTKNRIVSILYPLKWFLELMQDYGMSGIETILEKFKGLEESNNLNELTKNTELCLEICSNFLPEICEEKKRKKLKPLKSIKNIEYLLKILKGFVYLSNDEKDEIRNEIPQNIKKSVLVKEELILSIEKGFYLDIETNSSKYELTYLSAKKNKEFKKLYQGKNPTAVNILKTLDPIDELEKIFSDNSVNKKPYDALCEKMQFSEKTKNKLSKLVAGQRKKIRGNNLSNLLNRIKLLKKILIEENEKISNLWNKIKSQKSRQLIDSTILYCYLKDSQLRVAAEMLLFDCMTLFENVKISENPWIKSSRLYSGINLRNVISHGSPLLESLCELLDPEDLPSEMIKKMILLIQGEDSIEAALQLYEQVGSDFTQFLKVMNLEDKDIYTDLCSRIEACTEWKNYVLLLPYNPQTAIEET